jgi:cytochrome c biogenesis factor
MQENDKLDEPQSVEVAEDEVYREKWEKRRDESPRAFEAFSMYLNSEKRSLSDVARSSTFQCSVANISRWSIAHNWKDRAWAWDLKREEEQRQQLAKDRVAMRNRHLQLALAVQGIAAHSIRELQAKIASGTPLGLSPEETKAFMDVGVRLERATLGTEKARNYTAIQVIVSQYPDEESYESALRGGGPALIEDGNPDGETRPMEEEVNYGEQ